MMGTVESLRVDSIEMAHGASEITLGGLQKKMIVLCEAPNYVKLSASHF